MDYFTRLSCVIVILCTCSIHLLEARQTQSRSPVLGRHHSEANGKNRHHVHVGTLRRYMRMVRRDPSLQINFGNAKVTRGRRTLEESDLSGINRCSLLQERRQTQRQRVQDQLSGCSGLLVGPDSDGMQCTHDLGIFTYTFPSTLGMIGEYDLYIHVPSNNRVNLLNHMICAISSQISCATFANEELLDRNNRDSNFCYSRNITEIHQGHNQVKISVDFSCGPVQNCPDLWLEGVPLLNVVHRTQGRCQIC